MKKILTIVVICISYMFLTSSTQNTEINVWKKVSTDELNPGEIISLDMERGYSTCEGSLIYIIVRIVDSEEEVILAFPNGGYWVTPGPDPFLEALQTEFDSLEDYLRNQESKEIKKK